MLRWKPKEKKNANSRSTSVVLGLRMCISHENYFLDFLYMHARYEKFNCQIERRKASKKPLLKILLMKEDIT